MVPSVVTTQNYVQTCRHARVHTLAHSFTFTSSPPHPGRARAQLCWQDAGAGSAPGAVMWWLCLCQEWAQHCLHGCMAWGCMVWGCWGAP